MALAAATTRDWIRRQLGSPTVVVELTDDQLDDAIAEALAVYSKSMPKIIRVVVAGSAGVSSYVVPAGAYGRAAIDLEAEPIYQTGHEVDIFNPFELEMVYSRDEQGYTDYAMMLAGVKQAKAILSADLDWEFRVGDDPATDAGVLYISPPPADTRNYILVCVTDWTLADAPARQHSWLRKYALAHAKVTLGYIRRKFAEIQGTQTTLRTDGEALVQEGAAEMLALEDQMQAQQKSPALVPIRGM